MFAILALAAGLLGGMWLLLMAAPWLGLQPGQKQPFSLAGAALLFGLVLLVALFVAGLCRLDRIWRTLCPHCGHNLMHARSALVIATGRCPQCTAALWEQPIARETDAQSAPPESHGERLLTHAELNERRKDIRPDWRLAAWYVATAVAIAGVMWALRSPLAGLWERHWGTMTLPFLNPLLMMPSAVIIPLGLLAAMRNIQRELSVCSCPSCGTTIGREFQVAATGRCHRCGEPVLADPLPVIPTTRSANPIPVAEVRHQGDIWSRWGVLPCFLGLVPAAVWLAIFYPLLSPEGHEPAAAWQVAVLCVAFPLQIAGVALSHWILDSGLRCPNCRRGLRAYAPLVICSGNCPHCGDQIVDYGQQNGKTD